MEKTKKGFSLRRFLGLKNDEEFLDSYLEKKGLINIKKERDPDNAATPQEIKDGDVKVTPARSSEPPTGESTGWVMLDQKKKLVEPGYQFEVIPLIRKLSLTNPDLSQALNNYVSLANTGHKIVFDSDVKPEQVDEMRRHLDAVSENWHYGAAGMHGIINKMISQAMIAGAVCAEVLPNRNLTGVGKIGFPLPESIRFVYDKSKNSYLPYQKTNNPFYNKQGIDPLFVGLKPLNKNTFKYYAINGDTELPYGNPVYLPALDPLEDQVIMKENIKYIISQMGVMGFLELLVEKPEKENYESDEKYAARLKQYLIECSSSTKSGMRNGMMVGYQEDHQFQFHSASGNATGVSQLFDQNEALVFSGLKQDPAISGRGTKGTETNITIVFTKLLSELANIQLCVAKVVEYAYELELRLRGYDFKTVKVIPNKSTIQDDLKFQQALEIKIRNLRQLRMDGIIDQDTYADRLDIEKPAQQEPIVPFAPDKEGTGDPSVDAQKKAAREKSKDASDRKVRDKNKPQGTIKK